MQKTFSLHIMQCQTTGTTTDDTSTHYDATVTLFFIYRRKVKAERNPKNIRSHAKEVRQQLGLVVDVFTLVKDSDVPVLLVSQPTVVHVD